MNKQVVTVGAGCFWCVEAVFLGLKGVEKVESGYMGGKRENPTYEQVCSGATGHAEVAQITYDGDVLDFGTLLSVFFKTHDPTTLNRQGDDIGTQYRSAIFYHSPEQKMIAESIIEQLNNENAYPDPIVTEVSPAAPFYPAEDYHKDYLNRNPENAYCRYVVQPKVDKFRKVFGDLLK